MRKRKRGRKRERVRKRERGERKMLRNRGYLCQVWMRIRLDKGCAIGR